MAKKTTLPEEVGEYTALQAQSSFTDAEQKVFKALHEFITKRAKDDIWWYWELGQKIKQVYDDAQKNKEIYNKQLLPRLAKGLGYKTDAQLRNVMNVVAVFGTKKNFSAMVKMRGEAQNVLSWSHIVYLSHIGDDTIRNQVAATALEQCWTAADLWDKVKELTNRVKRGSGAKPKTKIPTSPVGMFTHVFSQANKFVQNFEDAWTGAAFNVVKSVADIPADKLNDKIVSAVQDTRAKLTAMKKAATSLEQLLLAAEGDMETRMTAQAEADSELDAAATESAEVLADDAHDADEQSTVSLSAERNKKDRAQRAKERVAAKKKKAKAAKAGAKK